MNSAETLQALEGSDAYIERKSLLQAIRDEKRSWTKVGIYEFRSSGNGWEAKAAWGVYVYAIPVTEERDAIALALGLAKFTSRSAGKGRRSNIQVQWR